VRKATKISKTGIVIRCSKCHLPGHNMSTCTNISGAGPSQAGGSWSAGGSSQPTGYKSLQDHSQQALSQLQDEPKCYCYAFQHTKEHDKWLKKDFHI
jgi:hypothetical protein